LNFSTGEEVSGSGALAPNICIHLPWWSASMLMRWQRNVQECYGQWSLLITRLTWHKQHWSSWKSVYHKHGSLQRYMHVTRSIACSLFSSWTYCNDACTKLCR